MKPLLKRIIGGALYAAAVAVGLLGPQLLFLTVFGFALVWTLHEFYTMSAGSDYLISRLLMSISVLALFVLVFYARLNVLSWKWLLLVLVPVLAGMSMPLYRFKAGALTCFSYLCAGLLYVALPLCVIPVLVTVGGVYNGLVALSLFILVSLNDVGAYFLGSTLGQRSGARKLAPTVSPNKSWWGLAGGVVVSVIACYGLSLLGWIPLHGTVHCIVFGLLMSISGTVGDLVESMWKRHFGVKDSGKLIPGHGGLYDRLDSILFAAPLAAIYFEISGLLQ